MSKDVESTMKWRLDITDLKSNIQKAKREIRLANSEFQNVTASMDDWRKSADGLTAKIKNLDSNYQNETEILKSLKEQYKLVASEQGENSKKAQDLTIKINNQSAKVQRIQKEIEKYTSDLKELESSESSNESATESLTKKIEEQEKELKTLKAEYQDTVLEKGKDSDVTKELANKISDLSADLDKNKQALKDASYGADDLSESLEDTKTSSEKAENGFTVLKGALAGLVLEGIKKAIDGMKELATESERASASFQASTGVSAESMERYNDVMQELYKNNFGDSLDDIAEAMSEVKRQTNELDPSTLKDLTKNAIALRDTFGYDVAESVRAVKMMMDQFGVSGEEAYNLIVQGAQNGLDKNGDLLDTINEYSVHYVQLGYDAEGFFNSLKNGTETGIFSIDKMADATKEFGIRVKDTANSTTEGFELIGLDADEMRAKFAKGGESAQRAMSQTLNALAGVDDQVKKNQAGVDLFGTMWEDLGETSIMSLRNIAGNADKSKRSMEQLNKVKYSDVGNQAKELGRLIKTDLLVPMAKELMPVVKDGITWTIKNSDTLIPIIKNVGKAIAFAFVVKTIKDFKTSIMDAGETIIKFSTKVPMASDALSKLGGFLTANPWVILAGAIAGVTIAIGGLIAQSMAANDEHKKTMDAIEEEIKARDDLREQQEEQLATNLGEIENLQSLNTELKNLVDANGHVKEGYENRVEFILNELNNALGTEMELNNGVISGYDGLSDSISSMLTKKRAEIILEAQLPAYKEAVTKSIEAQTKANQLAIEYNEAKMKSDALQAELEAKYGEDWFAQAYRKNDMLVYQWSTLEADTKNKETELNKQNELLKGYHEDIDSYEINSMRLQSDNADEIAKIQTDIVASKSDSYEAQKESLQAEIDFEKVSLDELKKKYKETNDETIKNQIESKELYLQYLNEQMQGITSTLEENKPSITKGYVEIAQGGLQALQSAHDDYKKAGKDNGNSYKDGAESVDTYSLGANYVTGIKNGTSAIDLYGVAFDLGQMMLSATKSALDEHSPSREGDWIGKFYIKGIANGVKNNISMVKSVIKDMGSTMIKDTKVVAQEANEALQGASLGLNKSNAIKQQLNTVGVPQQSTTSPVTYNQYNYSPKALSRMDIYRQTKSVLYKGGKN